MQQMTLLDEKRAWYNYTLKRNRLLELMDKNQDAFEGLANTGWFRDWLESNMHIYNEFERYAFDIKLHGKREYYSARMIIHRLRWDTLFREGASEFKINNNCTPYLARLAMLANPSLMGLFKLRAPWWAE